MITPHCPTAFGCLVLDRKQQTLTVCTCNSKLLLFAPCAMHLCLSLAQGLALLLLIANSVANMYLGYQGAQQLREFCWVTRNDLVPLRCRDSSPVVARENGVRCWCSSLPASAARPQDQLQTS